MIEQFITVFVENWPTYAIIFGLGVVEGAVIWALP